MECRWGSLRDHRGASLSNRTLDGPIGFSCRRANSYDGPWLGGAVAIPGSGQQCHPGLLYIWPVSSVYPRRPEYFAAGSGIAAGGVVGYGCRCLVAFRSLALSLPARARGTDISVTERAFLVPASIGHQLRLPASGQAFFSYFTLWPHLPELCCSNSGLRPANLRRLTQLVFRSTA